VDLVKGQIARFRDISVKWQLLMICILLVSVPVVFLGVLSYNTAKTTTYTQIEDMLQDQALIIAKDVQNIYDVAQEKVTSDLNVARGIILQGILSDRVIELDEFQTTEFTAVNQVTGYASTVTIPVMRLNGEPIAYNYDMVDRVKEMVGGTATIFQTIPQGILRISTNVLKEDGSRAVGTYIPTDSEVYQTVMRGQTYYGRAWVVNAWYLTAYEPIKDSKGKIIGVLYVGVKEDEYIKTIKDNLAELVIGKTGYIYILNEAGDYVLSLDQARDGENIWNSQDADGNYFIQEIVNKGTALKEGETAVTYYPWKNTGENSARMKLAGYAYFPDWGWVVASSAYQNDFLDGLNTIKNSTVLIVILSIIGGSIVAYSFAIFMTKNFKELVGKVNKVAEGDLRVSFSKDLGANEIGQISSSFDKMVSNLRTLVSSIQKNVNIAASSAEEVSASAQEVNSSMSQVNTTVQEVAKGAQVVSNNSSTSKEKAVKTAESAKAGNEASTVVNQKIEMIMATSKAAAEKIGSLGQKSEEIGKIVDTIKNISEQTNLLALNAAIEAARAGEAGRGFAVVADEVRKLAEESGKATGQISTLITDIQGEITTSVETMKNSTTEIDEGMAAVQEAMVAFKSIPELVEDVTKSLSEMASVAEENAAGSEEVSSAAEEVTSAMQQMSSSAVELTRGAEELKQLIARFKVDEGASETVTMRVGNEQPGAGNVSQKPSPEISPEAVRQKYEQEQKAKQGGQEPYTKDNPGSKEKPTE
jgi:methyl-accepting chemotaxis protein